MEQGTPKGQLSRASSISSLTSEPASFFPNISFAPHYLPSDVESEMEDSSTDLGGVSKEDLYAYVKKFERRAFKYKSKFMEVNLCSINFFSPWKSDSQCTICLELAALSIVQFNIVLYLCVRVSLSVFVHGICFLRLI